jgi:hypothetical protein
VKSKLSRKSVDAILKAALAKKDGEGVILVSRSDIEIFGKKVKPKLYPQQARSGIPLAKPQHLPTIKQNKTGHQAATNVQNSALADALRQVFPTEKILGTNRQIDKSGQPKKSMASNTPSPSSPEMPQKSRPASKRNHKSSVKATPTPKKIKRSKAGQFKPVSRPVVMYPPSADNSARAAARQSNDQSRLAFNTALMAKKAAEGWVPFSRSQIMSSIGETSFEDLYAAWRCETLRVGLLRQVHKSDLQSSPQSDLLVAIEGEWARRQEMAMANPLYFDWPSTIPSIGFVDSKPGGWHEMSYLSAFGYHVGKASELLPNQRRYILEGVFAAWLPPLNGIAYVKRWGLPQSSERLHAMANTVAMLVKGAKRKKISAMGAAIADWENDLEHLRLKFYCGRFHFDWPHS